MKVDTMIYRTHKPYEKSHGVSRLRENLTSGSDGEGLETGQVVPRQSFTRQLFFKWIKQHLKIKSFYGTNQNAVFCQIWIALCTYLIIAIAKKRWKIDQSLYSFSQICGITPFEKVPINELFSKSSTSVPVDGSPNLFSNNHF